MQQFVIPFALFFVTLIVRLGLTGVNDQSTDDSMEGALANMSQIPYEHTDDYSVHAQTEYIQTDRAYILKSDPVSYKQFEKEKSSWFRRYEHVTYAMLVSIEDPEKGLFAYATSDSTKIPEGLKKGDVVFKNENGLRKIEIFVGISAEDANTGKSLTDGVYILKSDPVSYSQREDSVSREATYAVLVSIEDPEKGLFAYATSDKTKIPEGLKKRDAVFKNENGLRKIEMGIEK